jgi:hypothetical protein
LRDIPEITTTANSANNNGTTFPINIYSQLESSGVSINTLGNTGSISLNTNNEFSVALSGTKELTINNTSLVSFNNKIKIQDITFGSARVNNDVTTSSPNISIGNNSLIQNTSGIFNISIGNNSLENNTEGSSNISIGNNSLNENIQGSSNISIGNNSLENNTEGTSNISIGNNSLSSNTNGISNTSLGYNSGENSLGNNNIFVGALSGQGISTGNNNICIGFYSGPTDGIQYNNGIFIGTNTETMLVQGGFNWNTSVINTDNYDLSQNPPIRQIYFIDEMNDNLSSPKIILPIPSPSNIYSGKHIVFRRRNNIVDIIFECYATETIDTGELDIDGNPITITNSIGYIIYKDSNTSQTELSMPANMYVISFVCDGEKWYQIQ